MYIRNMGSTSHSMEFCSSEIMICISVSYMHYFIRHIKCLLNILKFVNIIIITIITHNRFPVHLRRRRAVLCSRTKPPARHTL